MRRNDDDGEETPRVSIATTTRRNAVRGALAVAIGGLVSATTPAALATTGEDLLDLRRTEEAKSRERIEKLYEELRAEEAKAIELRYMKEGEAQAELNRLREESESKSREQVLAGKTLCVTPFGIDIVGITEFVALAGAVASGLSVNQKKQEIEALNDKLRKINASLMSKDRGVRSEVPVGGGALEGDALMASTASMDDFDSLSDDAKELKMNLRAGRQNLRDKASQDALISFKKALMLARVVGDKVSERRAIRGLGAAKRQMGDRLGAIEDLKQVLTVSQELNDDTGDMDALGAIADLYTELGDLENAGRYYDLYLNQINDETVELED